MLKRIIDWKRRSQAMGWFAGAIFISRAAGGGGEQSPDPTQNTVTIVIVILAIALPFIIGGGIAVTTWLVSLGTPTPLVAVEQKKIIKRDILPEGVHLPPPSARPFVLSLGITLICIGILFRSFAISFTPDFNLPIILVIGALVTALGLGGWIGDDLRARKSH